MKQKLLLKSLLLLCALVVGVSSAWAGEPEIIWSESFDGLSANATPATPTNTSYTGVTYSCTDGTGTSPGSTKIMNEKLAGGANAPEMMIGKKGGGAGTTGGKFTAVIPLDNFEGTLTLTYYQNKQTLKVSSTTEGISGGQSIKPSDVGQQTTTFTGITAAMTSITIVFESTTTNNVRLDDIVLTGKKASAIAAPTFSPGEGVYTSAQKVTISTKTEGATIHYTTDGTDPTTSSPTYSSAITVNTTTTIKAIAVKNGNNNSDVATATFIFTNHVGTKEDPYSVEDARNVIDYGIGTQGVYAQGIVSKIVTAYQSDYGNISYNISTDGKAASEQLQAYRGKSFGGTKFTSEDDIKVGDIVIVYGNLTKYGSTYEFAADNQLARLNDQYSVTIPDSKVTTFCSPNAVDFTGSGVTAYTAKGNGYVVTLTPIANGIVPAKTGVILRADAAGTYTGTITDGGSITNQNEMVGVLVDTYVHFNNTSTTGIGCFILQKGAFYKAGDMNAAKLRSGKAYLKTTYNDSHGNNNAPLAIVFEGETTGITNTNCTNDTNISVVYDLSGRRVAQPTKGLYIVNGRKMIIK